MTNFEAAQGIMKLGVTETHSYIGFQPPLTEDEHARLPTPIYDGEERQGTLYDIEAFDDNSEDLGFNSLYFAPPESLLDLSETFLEYATRVAKHLGHYSLDPETREVGHGSVVSQAEPVAANW
jgi:hypothetical protein